MHPEAPYPLQPTGPVSGGVPTRRAPQKQRLRSPRLPQHPPRSHHRETMALAASPHPSPDPPPPVSAPPPPPPPAAPPSRRSLEQRMMTSGAASRDSAVMMPSGSWYTWRGGGGMGGGCSGRQADGSSGAVPKPSTLRLPTCCGRMFRSTDADSRTKRTLRRAPS